MKRIMGFIGERVFTLLFISLMLLPQIKKMDGASSTLSSVIVVAFDVELLSNAFDSFAAKAGDKDSFDLVICVPFLEFSDKKLEDVIRSKVLEYRSIISNCSHLAPPVPTDYNQIVYLMTPDNKTAMLDTLAQISKLYHTIKETFYSTTIPKLLWMPLFLVIWPDFQDYCQNESTSERLIRASLHRNENVRQSFNIDSDVYFYFGYECNGVEDNVWEVFTINSTSDITVQKLTPDRIKYEAMYEGMLGRVRRRLNLQESAIRAVVSKDPSSFLEDSDEGILDPLEIINGTSHVVFSELRETLNFTEVNIPGDWISRFKNGTLKGTTMNLFRKDLADVTISLTSLLPYRKVELSFLQPTYFNSVNGFFVQPHASTLRDIVVAPFSFGLWISLFLTYIILMASILYFSWQQKRMYNQSYKKIPENDVTLKKELGLWAIGAITQKGWHICPESNATRLVFILGYLLGLVCYGAFSAAVVSILAVELVPIKSRSDLLSSNLNFYADNASSTMAYIVDYLRRNTTAKFGQRVNIKEGVSKLKSKDPSCYIAFPQYFYLSAANIGINETWICGHLSVIPVTTTWTPSSMVVPRNSPYAELLNFMILKMIARGLNYRFVQLYNRATTWACVKDAQPFYHPLGLQDMVTACFILFAGMLFSIMLLFLEGCRKCVSGRKEKTSSSGSKSILA